MNDHRVSYNHNPLLEHGVPVWRARLVLAILLLLCAVLLWRAAWLQGVHKEFLQAKGESRYARTLEVPATRGRILDRHGDVLAISTPVRSIWAIPADARSMEPGQLRQLAALLEMNVNDVHERLAAGRDFVFLRRQVAPAVAAEIAELKLPGIHQQREFRRYYPGGEVMAHILGFTDVEDRGQEGIELAYESRLAGQPGARRVIRHGRGEIIEDVEAIRPPRDGEDVILAIDAKIQYLAHTALRETVTEHRAQGGSVIVLDAHSGEVLALANNPTYNPNNRSTLSGAQLRNRAITDTFEPGSTMKPFIAALAMEKGQADFDSLIETGNGRMNLGNATISDVKAHGTLSLAQVIQKSSNIGVVRLAMNFSPEEMWHFYTALGFGTAPGLGFPGEAGGRLRPYRSWRPIEQATMSYGYGLNSSLLQIAKSYLVLTHDGERLPLSLLRLDTPPPRGERVLSPQTASQVRTMLEMAAAPGGTATRAQIAGFRVAGKTGTAHKVEAGRYTRKYISSFVGFAPASDPRIVVAVMIDEPSAGQHFGGAVAAPVFARVAGGALRSLGVAPDVPHPAIQVASPTLQANARNRSPASSPASTPNRHSNRPRPEQM